MEQMQVYVNFYEFLGAPSGVLADGGYKDRAEADQNRWEGPVFLACKKITFVAQETDD